MVDVTYCHQLTLDVSRCHHPRSGDASVGARQGGYAVDFRGEVQLAVLDRMGLLNQVRDHRTGGIPRDSSTKPARSAVLVQQPGQIRPLDLQV
jgi:hypothetical protein